MSGIIAQNTLDGSGLIKSPAGGGAWNFIKKLSGSGATTMSFVNGSSDVVLDSTYKTYVFTLNNMHGSSNGDGFTVNFSTDTGSNYNATKTTSLFLARHDEDDSPADVAYDSRSQDLAESTGIQPLTENSGADADQSVSGVLWLFDPSNTTFLKHFWCKVHHSHKDNIAENIFISGYCNTTSAVDAVRFEYGNTSTTNIDEGDICLYGIST